MFSPCRWFYRNKSYEYYNCVMYSHGGIMIPYLKDHNGDQSSPINGRIQGLFFSAAVDHSNGQMLATSPFGPRRLCVDASYLFSTTPNMYFADFYCHTRPHYVTIVLTRPYSVADSFCRRKLIRLDPETNVFMRVDPTYRRVWVNRRVHVEVLYTENIDINFLLHYSRGYFVDTRSTGTSRPGGIPKNPSCRTCNLWI